MALPEKPVPGLAGGGGFVGGGLVGGGFVGGGLAGGGAGVMAAGVEEPHPIRKQESTAVVITEYHGWKRAVCAFGTMMFTLAIVCGKLLG